MRGSCLYGMFLYQYQSQPRGVKDKEMGLWLPLKNITISHSLSYTEAVLQDSNRSSYKQSFVYFLVVSTGKPLIREAFSLC